MLQLIHKLTPKKQSSDLIELVKDKNKEIQNLKFKFEQLRERELLARLQLCNDKIVSAS